MDNNYKIPLPKEAKIIPARQPPHPSIRAHLAEEFRLEICDTCCKTPKTPVCSFISANKSQAKMFTGLDDCDRYDLLKVKL